MKKLDPRLRHVLRQRLVPVGAAVPANEATLGEAAGQELEKVEVLLRCRGANAAERLAEAGMQVRSTLSGPVSIVSGVIPLDLLPALNELPYVRQIRKRSERRFGP